MSRSFIDALFAAKGLPLPQIKVASYSVPLQYSLCAMGKFISATSGLTLHFSGERVRALPVDLPVWPWPVALVTLKNRTISPTVNVFVEHVRTFFAQLRQQIDGGQSHRVTARAVRPRKVTRTP